MVFRGGGPLYVTYIFWGGGVAENVTYNPLRYQKCLVAGGGTPQKKSKLGPGRSKVTFLFSPPSPFLLEDLAQECP